MSHPRLPPGPASPEELPREALADPLRLLTHLAHTYGDIVRCPSSYGQSYLLNRPEYVRHFLHAPGWTRTDLLKIALGESTLSADGPEWRKKRRIVQPGFERARIEGFGPLMVDEARKLADAWAREEGPVDVDAAMMKLTLRIVVRSLFSADVEPHVETVSKALTQVIADLGALTSTLFAVPVAFAPDRNRRMKAALGDLDRVVFEILDERRARPRAEWPPDLLTTLLTARDPDTGDALDDAQLRDELVTMLVAGHETTATMLGWAWYLLGEHPEVEAAWHADLDARFGDRDPAPEDLLQPSFTRDLVQETLRLYPPVWAIARRVTETQALDGYRIEGRSAAFICPFLLHRHPGWWRDPERFDPSRFAEGEARIERYAYVPFARGPHMCSGHHFATLEGQIILAVLGRRFRLRKVPGHEVKPLPLVTLRFEGGLPMTLEPRG